MSRTGRNDNAGEIKECTFVMSNVRLLDVKFGEIETLVRTLTAWLLGALELKMGWKCQLGMHQQKVFFYNLDIYYPSWL